MHAFLGGKKSHLSLKEAILPQPPSFAKKRNYEIKAQLGEGTFGKVKVGLLPIVILHPPQRAPLCTVDHAMRCSNLTQSNVIVARNMACPA
jgi:hypothetical protein